MYLKHSDAYRSLAEHLQKRYPELSTDVYPEWLCDLNETEIIPVQESKAERGVHSYSVDLLIDLALQKKCIIRKTLTYTANSGTSSLLSMMNTPNAMA